MSDLLKNAPTRATHPSDQVCMATISSLSREISRLERENAALRADKERLVEAVNAIAAPHYIIDHDLRAAKFRDALRIYKAAIDAARKEASHE